MYKYVLIAALLIIIGAGVFAGCSQQSTPAPSTPAPSSPTPPKAAQVADLGATVYTSHCANCHGATGGGASAPALIGANAHLGKYNTGQGLLDFVDKTMPANSPGSLSHQDYLNVVAYLLVQDNYMSGDSDFVESQLGSVNLQ